MAVTKAKKAEQIEKLSADLKGVNNMVVATFGKLTVNQDFELRKAVRSAGGKYSVVKNKLAGRASQGTALEEALKGLKGVTSIAYTTGDPVALAKAIGKYVIDNGEQFSVKGGVVEGKMVSAKEVAALATMPSKEELYSKLLFLINAPAQRLVTVMNAVGRDVAVVINQAVEQKKFKGDGAEAPVAAVAEASAPEAAQA
ncbi:MAG: ribosomal protein L10p [Acidobacteriales bacterium]|nr:ribosomal protein L10p [Terriglobales bacterium]